MKNNLIVRFLSFHGAQSSQLPSFNFLFLAILLLVIQNVDSNDSKRLYNNLMVDYNRLVRPVNGSDDLVNVSIGLKMTHLSLNLESQILSTNVWLEQQWVDRRLTWSPFEFGGLDKIHLLANKLWLPDIAHYNNADEHYDIQKSSSKALVHFNGLVEWNPLLQLKSSCHVNIHYYPYDFQNVYLRFGAWTKQGINLKFKNQSQSTYQNEWYLKNGIDLSAFQANSEYDIMDVPAQLVLKKSASFSKPHPEIIFNIKLRRKALFYFVNLILPCMIINGLSILTFYLPVKSKEKLTLSVSLLVTLTILLLILIEMIPKSSFSVPLINRYLFFTLCQITLSIVLSILVVNVSKRRAVNYVPNGITKILLRYLPNLLKIHRPDFFYSNNTNCFFNNPSTTNSTARSSISGCYHSCATCQSFLPVRYHLENLQSEVELNSHLVLSRQLSEENGKLNTMVNSNTSSTIKSTKNNSSSSSSNSSKEFEKNSKILGQQNKLKNDNHEDLKIHLLTNDKSRPFEFIKAVNNLNFLANRIQNSEKYSKIKVDFQFLALLLDRLFLWLFSFSCIIGWITILFQSPSLYDNQQPIDRLYEYHFPKTS